MLVPFIVLLLFVIVTLIQLRNPRHISRFAFRFRLVASGMLLLLVWATDNPQGRMQYKILMTVMALVAMYVAYVQYKKASPKNVS